MSKRQRLGTALKVVFVLFVLGGVVGSFLTARQALEVSLMNAFSQEPVHIARVLDETPMPFFMLVPMIDMWNEARAGNLGKGDIAPDFTLQRESGGEPVTLSSFKDQKPVVLIFGSYT